MFHLMRLCRTSDRCELSAVQGHNWHWWWLQGRSILSATIQFISVLSASEFTRLCFCTQWIRCSELAASNLGTISSHTECPNVEAELAVSETMWQSVVTGLWCPHLHFGVANFEIRCLLTSVSLAAQQRGRLRQEKPVSCVCLMLLAILWHQWTDDQLSREQD